MARAEIAGQKALKEQAFAATPVSIPAARDFVVTALGPWLTADRVDDARLCVSELATNVVRHDAETATEFCVRLSRTTHTVRLEVQSRGSWRPTEQQPGPESASGRGLVIVTAFADDWGVELTPPCLLVWADFKIEI